ncbi:hypothetical protein TNIN_494081 [Trichonephila inaurata madagascariensis]|uniref:Uncharacterized protein n=1 Tax=Trichonephila inaurata madagascariensis TaxID=2747483 RepID=A0A8X7BZZ4_9ARAC|nr:hypothetical protein TNIN_494081 [Trichonephila inaurata madagascariensis]
MTDVIANNGENLTPGIVINHPNGNDVYKGVPKDYSGEATTAANSEESSYACYFDDKRDTYLGDSFSVHWMEDTDQEVQTTETLQKPVFVPKVKKDSVRNHDVYIEIVKRKLMKSNSEEKQSVLTKKLN